MNRSSLVAHAASVTPPTWHEDFLKLLPNIEHRLRFAFRRLSTEAKDEATQEAVGIACRDFARLEAARRTQFASAAALARYAAAQYRSGRRIGTSQNVNDICSELCRHRYGITVERLGEKGKEGWQEALVEDRTITPADLAASRIDYLAFLESIGPHKRRLAEVLATGESTSAAARLFGVTAARVSQLRRELHMAWLRFHGDVERPTATATA